MDLTTRPADAAAGVAGAMATDPAQVTGAAWQSRPPSLVTGALLSEPLAGFRSAAGTSPRSRPGRSTTSMPPIRRRSPAVTGAAARSDREGPAPGT